MEPFFLIVLGMTAVVSQSDGYIYVNTQKTADDAESYCQNTYGTNLASIHSVVQHTGAAQACASGAGCWIGLNDKLSEGSWIWNDQSLFDYSNWNGGQAPSGATQDCIEIRGDVKKWDDKPCAAVAVQKHFLCNKYIYVDIAKTADDAEVYCREQYGTNLASISDAFNNELAKSACLSVPCWIGLNDKLSEATWVWNDHSLFNYRDWYDGEPNNDGDCVMIGFGGELWNDAPCNNVDVKLHFLCNAVGSPTATPTRSPTPSTLSPTPSPTPSPSPAPTSNPTAEPTYYPTTAEPTGEPTNEPTSEPTSNPSSDPTYYPTVIPTSPPTSNPSLHPTYYPKVISRSPPTNDVKHLPSTTANTNTNIQNIQTVQKMDNSLFIVAMTICTILGLMLILCVLIFFKFLYKNGKKGENKGDEPPINIVVSSNDTPSTNLDTDNFAMTESPKLPSLANMNALTVPGLSEQHSLNIEGDDDVNDVNCIDLEETQSRLNEEMYENPEGIELKGDTLGGMNM